MPADLVLRGTILTVDDRQPTAEALAVSDGRIVAVGARSDVEGWIGPGTEVRDVDGCVLPGLVEAHGHPLMEAIVLSDRMVDIRPVTLPEADDVVAAIRSEVADRGSDVAYLNGWDSLLQNGLPDPTLAWLDEIAPDTPLVIVHNSGHKAFFNSAAARRFNLTRDTPDPKGARFGRDADGELDGTAEETAAVLSLLAGVISPADYPAKLHAELRRLNAAGLTTCSEMAFDPVFRPVIGALRDDLTVRLRLYEISNAALHTDATPGDGDDLLRQVGIKIWVDGSPWIGNIALSFPYLDTDATRSIGIPPGSCGHANYTREQLTEIVHTYFPQGWPLACHVQGDAGVDTILDVYEEALRRWPRDDHRLRLEHVGAIRDEQLRRAHDLGVTCSLFVDQIHYWGDVIVDGLFGPERGNRWMPCGSALATGMRISLHNDPPVTPEEPLRNISVAATRTAPSGRVLGPEQRISVQQAIRAQTLDAAYQLFSDDVIGSLEVGKYADMVVLSADPRTVPPADIADLEVCETYLAGQRVYRKGA
ncbi:putative TIM-barrel fold metal-dependent hydrolase [Mycolicibacterium phlei]|uniref:Amidohydrolase n=1 Tax=Mycolicibacterium phlei DSM 43239 = CCUG 21000 TaxID=1226750 RepID=A0A5N5VDA9_MYCPH|nr:amidohydrolase [Mycolicibacterium phlei]VEG11289.1 putative TIM-barrel fold metal-dependent hydrolase [Mycobacteroides chelonae]AMO63192.1 N-substituted formamide deformylase precursor [Mycolicibacterium phlei]KAB7759941.1 amidohydrolase [Mycolicibacterium phlei DSM 43239 = CCUG 21000]KXW64309.1 amidohydrolase [Mycolicibacterium phlei DSM 43072]KXW68988.1 amidohydrolase [Mycolicibacterium phlei DSM 43239 = CCUG 21000]